MKRRDFFKSTFGINTIQKANNMLFNENIDNEAGLEPFAGDWDINTATHLLRRALFGFREEDLNAALEMGFSATINKLLDDEEPMPAPPIKFFDYNDGLEIGDTFIDKPLNFAVEALRTRTVQAWLWGTILNQGFSLREKMTLFWTNHFSTQASVVTMGRFQYQMNQLLRENSMGNFKKMVKDITLDPNMMIFLNGYENIVGSPNENYARELFELFTLGKGEQRGEGDYTTFTEQDVIESAKVLTGYNFEDFRKDNYNIIFYPFLHDYSTKRFSYAFNDQEISGTGENELDQLINMIFSKDEAAKFIVRKLYRWFVFYRISDKVEENIISPLAKLFKDNDYNIKPVISTLLSSQHFFDMSVRGAMIKNPADFLIGLAKTLRFRIPTYDVENIENIYEEYYTWYFHFYVVGDEQEMNVLEPPSVAGWEAYYQFPNYYRKWITSATYPLRARFVHRIMSDKGLIRTVLLKAYGLDYATQLEGQDDPNKVIEDLCQRFYPFEVTTEQKEMLKQYLVSEGQGDYVWGNAWYEYLEDPDNVIKSYGVENKLSKLISAATDLPEFQLM